MNKSLITLLLLSSASAFASEAADDAGNRGAFDGQRTRAEVKAELARAQRAGGVNYGENAGGTLVSGPVRSIDEIRAEAAQAARTRVAHELY